MPETLSDATVTVRINGEGAIELPRSLLERHGWSAGTVLEVVVEGDEIVLRESTPVPAEGRPSPRKISLEEFLSRIPKVSGAYPTDEEIAEMVGREAARRFDEKTRG